MSIVRPDYDLQGKTQNTKSCCNRIYLSDSEIYNRERFKVNVTNIVVLKMYTFRT